MDPALRHQERPVRSEFSNSLPVWFLKFPEIHNDNNTFIDNTNTKIYFDVAVFTALHTDHIDNVILAYNPDILHKVNEGSSNDIDVKNVVSANLTKASPISLGGNIGEYKCKTFLR